MGDITNLTDRQVSVQIDKANVKCEAPDTIEQDIEISYIEIKPLPFNTDVDVVDQYQPCKLEDTSLNLSNVTTEYDDNDVDLVDQYQPCKLEDTYQNCTTVTTEYDDNKYKTTQHCSIALKEDNSNLHIDDSEANEILSSTQTDPLMYPSNPYFRCHDIDVATKSEANVFDLQIASTCSEHGTLYHVKRESTYTNLQSVSDNMAKVRMSHFQASSHKRDLDLESTSTPPVAATSTMFPCYVKLTRIPSLDRLSKSGFLNLKVEDLHKDIKPRYSRKISYQNSRTVSKPYQCPHCDSRFTKKSILVNHIGIHTGIKPYKCEHCDARFTRKDGLSTHVRIHTGIKPYICEHCDPINIIGENCFAK